MLTNSLRNSQLQKYRDIGGDTPDPRRSTEQPWVLALAIVVLRVVIAGVTLLKRVTVGDPGSVDEYVFATILGLDEAEALLRVEELHSSCRAHLRYA